MTRTAVSIVTACIAAAVASADSAKNRSAAPAAPTADPIHSLRLDPEERRLPLRAAPPQRRAADAPPLLTRGGAVDLLDAADQYDFFDGFETYELGPLSGQLMNAPLGVLLPVSQQHVHIVDTAAESLPHARDPFGTGNAQHLKNARGDTGMVSTQPSETQWRLDLDRLYFPMFQREVIVCTDFYFPDLETLDSWETISFSEGFITTRVLQAGYYDSNLTNSTGGVLTRPAILGAPDGFGFLRFVAPPLDTGTNGELAPFTTRTNEWFTIAVRLSTNGVTIWIRDGQTDGSNGVLIEDPSGTPFFESGWYRIYPGRAAQESMPGVWTGYGLVINASGGEVDQTEHFLAARSIDSIRSMWFSGTAIPDDPDWAPTNRHFDNVCIIGGTHPPTPVPKRRLPYKDDFELYPASGPGPHLFGWINASSDISIASGNFNGASVNTTPPPGSDGSGAPNRSIMHRNEGNSAGVARRVMWTSTPIDDQRPWAVEGDPVRVGANFRHPGFGTTRYGLRIADYDVDGADEALHFGADPAMGGSPDLRFHIRRPNPAFDPGAPPTDDGYFGAPFGTANPPTVNYPTTTAVTFGASFFNAELTLFGDGTASWSVDGSPLEIDSAFALSDPDVLDELQVARLIETGGATDAPPYTRFLTAMGTFDTVEVWSDNASGGFNERVFMDDLCIDGPARAPGAGPAFELPYHDDFSMYAADQPVAGQGVTPFSAPRIDAGGALLLIEAPEKGAGPEQLFCRYRIDDIQPEPDFSGDPFDCPDGWIVDAFAAIPAFEGEDCPSQIRFGVRNDEDCPTCSGIWTLLSSEPEAAQGADLLTHMQSRKPTPRWLDLIHDSDPAFRPLLGEGSIRDADSQSTIDPLGERGAVLAFVNNGGDIADRLQAELLLPELIVTEQDEGAGARSAALHWDVYVQDHHTRNMYIVRGPRFHIDDGARAEDDIVAGVRLGGPPQSSDDADQDEIAVLRPDQPGPVWEGVGVTAPIGAWVRLRLDLERAGPDKISWRLGMNTSGLVGGPGGPVESGGDGMGDRPEHFDASLPGAHTDAVFLASGEAPVENVTNLTPPLGVRTFEFRRGDDASGAPGNPNNPGGAPSRWWVDQIHLEEVLGDPPPPPCPWDLTGSGTIGSGDVGYLLGCWGVVTAPSCAIADLTNSGAVGSADLAAILGNWGPCPE